MKDLDLLLTYLSIRMAFGGLTYEIRKLMIIKRITEKLGALLCGCR